MARRGPEGYGLVQPPLMGRDARRPSRTESFAKLMPAIPFAQGGEYFSSSAGWQQRLAYTFTVLLFAVACASSPPLVPGSSRRAQDAARTIYPKHDAPFSNGHYVPGCTKVRYGALFMLTPRECDLGRRIIFAIACGGTVGYERRRVDRPAGIRTMALVALGACVFTITSIFAEDGPMSWDSSRVAAAIPSGVGFLGAGLIWKMKVRSPLDPDGPEHEQIHGLTTAASTWVAASVGIAAGGAMDFVAAYRASTPLIFDPGG
ncbi:MgtC-like protein [Aureococcus anophagefferens]|nr:MgtC-like protein [Aureococcus anophagefferens]